MFAGLTKTTQKGIVLTIRRLVRKGRNQDGRQRRSESSKGLPCGRSLCQSGRFLCKRRQQSGLGDEEAPVQYF